MKTAKQSDAAADVLGLFCESLLASWPSLQGAQTVYRLSEVQGDLYACLWHHRVLSHNRHDSVMDCKESAYKVCC